MTLAAIPRLPALCHLSPTSTAVPLARFPFLSSLSEAYSPLPPGLHPQHYPQPFIAQLSEGPFLSHSSALEGASRQPGEPSDPFNKSAPSLPSRVLSSPKAVHPPLGCPAPRPDPQDPCLALSGPTSLEPYLQALFPVLQHPPPAPHLVHVCSQLNCRILSPPAATQSLCTAAGLQATPG